MRLPLLLLLLSALSSYTCAFNPQGASQQPFVGPAPPPPRAGPAPPKGPVAWVMRNVLRFNDTQIKGITEGAQPRKSRYLRQINDTNFEGYLLSENARGVAWVIDVYGNTEIMKIYSDSLVEVAEKNSSAAGGDLPNYYRFGRIDYLKVDLITTLWMLFKPPALVVSYMPEDAPSPATMKDLELRFFLMGALPTAPESVYIFLKDEMWKQVRPWRGSTWSPDGWGHPFLWQVGRGLMKFHSVTDRIPQWFMLVGSGMVANWILAYFHKPSAATTQQVAQDQDRTAAAASHNAGRQAIVQQRVSPPKELDTSVPAWGSKVGKKGESKKKK